jgi:hypothetical protein
MTPTAMVSTNTEVTLTLGLRMETLVSDKLTWLSEPLPGEELGAALAPGGARPGGSHETDWARTRQQGARLAWRGAPPAQSASRNPPPLHPGRRPAVARGAHSSGPSGGATPRNAPAMSIDDFNILKPISRGAFGRVYLAEKKSTGGARSEGGALRRGRASKGARLGGGAAGFGGCGAARAARAPAPAGGRPLLHSSQRHPAPPPVRPTPPRRPLCAQGHPQGGRLQKEPGAVHQQREEHHGHRQQPLRRALLLQVGASHLICVPPPAQCKGAVTCAARRRATQRNPACLPWALTPSLCRPAPPPPRCAPSPTSRPRSFQSPDNLYLVMEYLNGGDCARWAGGFKGSPLSNPGQTFGADAARARAQGAAKALPPPASSTPRPRA